MIGVAFAIHETFGRAHDIERAALEEVASRFARTRGLDAEAAVAAKLANEPDATFASPALVRAAFSSALGSALSTRVTPEVFEGLIRGAAARVTIDRFVPDDGVEAVLSSLAELNVPRAALSTRWPGVDLLKAEVVGFDGTVVYADVNLVDRNPLAPIVRLTEALRLPSDRIYFVGTDPRLELHLAALAGMRTVWLARDESSYPTELGSPDFTIERLSDILPILSGPYTRGLLGLRDLMRTTLGWREGYFVRNNADIMGDDDAR